MISLWLAAAALIAGVVSVKVLIYRDYNKEMQRAAQFDQQRAVLLVQMRTQLDQMEAARITRDAFMIRMASFKQDPPEQVNARHYEIGFYDPATDCEFVAHFSDDEFYRWEYFPQNPSPDSGAWRKYSIACFLMAASAGIASTFLVLWAVAHPQRRKVIGQTLIAIALVSWISRAAAESQSAMLQFSIGIDTAFLLVGVVCLLPKFRRQNDDYLCKTCNYNLTGNTSGICPECGSVVRVHAAITTSSPDEI